MRVTWLMETSNKLITMPVTSLDCGCVMEKEKAEEGKEGEESKKEKVESKKEKTEEKSEKSEEEKKEEKRKEKRKEREKKRKEGTDLIVRQLTDTNEVSLMAVSDYRFTKDGKHLFYIVCGMHKCQKYP